MNQLNENDATAVSAAVATTMPIGLPVSV